MDNIKVSVILPVYNVEKFLVQCLDSIVSQTLREIEIICVDDGSTDSSLEIIKEYAQRDSRIIVIEQANAGAGAARNNGLALARGEYLSFLDSDDFFEPDMLEIAYNTAVKDKSDIVVFNSDQYLEDTGEYKSQNNSINKTIVPSHSPFERHEMTGNTFTAFIGWAWDKLFRADFIREHGLLYQEQRTTNDMLFVFSAIVLSKKISVADKILLHQRRNIKSSLSNTRERSWDCFYNALTALRENLVSYGLMDELEQDFINYALHFSFWNLETITGSKKEVLYNKLKNEWFKELGIADKPASYFYSKKEYKKYLTVKNNSFKQYSLIKTFRKTVRTVLRRLPTGRR